MWSDRMERENIERLAYWPHDSCACLYVVQVVNHSGFHLSTVRANVCFQYSAWIIHSLEEHLCVLFHEWIPTSGSAIRHRLSMRLLLRQNWQSFEGIENALLGRMTPRTRATEKVLHFMKGLMDKDDIGNKQDWWLFPGHISMAPRQQYCPIIDALRHTKWTMEKIYKQIKYSIKKIELNSPWW